MMRIYLLSLLMLISHICFAGTSPVLPPPTNLSSEQDSVLQDCINNGAALGLTGAEIDTACPANRSPIPFTNNRVNQVTSNNNNTPNGNGNGNNSVSLNDINSPQGMNAGMEFGDLGVWANLSHTRSEYSLIPWESDSSAFQVGAHKNVGPSGIMGISIGIAGTEVDTLFNGGEQELTDYSVALYGSTLVTNNISVGANLGYIFRDMDQFRLGVGAGGFAIGEQVNGKTDSNTWFASANVDGYWQVQAFSLGSHASVLYSSEEIDGFTETGATGGATNAVADQENDLGVLRVGFDIGYTNPGFVEPYLALDYLYYFENQTVSAISSTAIDDDDTEFVYSIGARFYRDNVTGSISYSDNFSRDFLDYSTVNATITIDL